MTYTQVCKREAVRLAQAFGKQITQVSRELGISDMRVHRWRKELAEHGYFSFPKSINQVFTRKRCTATRTATPTKNSKHWRYAAKTRPRNEARGGRLRTVANLSKRFPYALLYALFATSQVRIEAA